MQSKIDKYKDKNMETSLKHTLTSDNECTQLGDVASVYSVPEEAKFHSIEELHNSENNLSHTKIESKDKGLNKMTSISTTCSFKGTEDSTSMVWDEIQYLKLLNSFQVQECNDENLSHSSPESNEDPNLDKGEKNTLQHNYNNYNQITNFNNTKVVFRNNKFGLNVNGKSSSSKSFDEFTSVCEALSSYTNPLPPKNPVHKLDSSLCSKDFNRDFRFTEDLLTKQTGRYFNSNLGLNRLNKDSTSQHDADTDSDSSSTILSTSSGNESTYMDKSLDLDERFQKELGFNTWFNHFDTRPKKKLRKNHLLMHPEPPPTSLDKYMSILNNFNKYNKNNENSDFSDINTIKSDSSYKGSNKDYNNNEDNKEHEKEELVVDDNNNEDNNENNSINCDDNKDNKEKQDKYKENNENTDNEEQNTSPIELLNDIEWRSRMDWKSGDKLEKNILESLDKIGGIKYEPGSFDLRRKYKSFEQLCFGLGCVVAPTKQELEMCSQLSQLGDESTLSQYETSVYQSCLLRTRSFEGIWKKFCNRSIGIIRKYILQGIYRLLSLIEFQNLVEPFLKVILLDLGTDRQDQQLFLNIVQEEMNLIIKDKFILVKLNSTNSLNLDDIIEQMYIQLYKMTLLSTKSINFEGNLSFINMRNGIPDIATKLENVKSETGEENLLEKLIKLYNKNFGNYELVIILDKLNPKVNDLLYLLQMLRTRELIPIKCIMIVCTNNEQLERYCNSRIYSNLGVFDCNMINVPLVIDDIIQVVMFDPNVQDFLPNYRMLHEIYELFYFQDCSLTLFILRIYQLYEQYYNRYIFSYLSTVPSFVFDDQSEQNIQENMMVSNKCQLVNGFNTNNFKISRDPNRISNMLLNISGHPDEKKDAKTQLEQLLLPKESFTKDKNLIYSPKMSEISTTSTLKSLAMMSGFDKTPSNYSEDNNNKDKEEQEKEDKENNYELKPESLVNYEKEDKGERKEGDEDNENKDTEEQDNLDTNNNEQEKEYKENNYEEDEETYKEEQQEEEITDSVNSDDSYVDKRVQSRNLRDNRYSRSLRSSRRVAEMRETREMTKKRKVNNRENNNEDNKEHEKEELVVDDNNNEDKKEQDMLDTNNKKQDKEYKLDKHKNTQKITNHNTQRIFKHYSDKKSQQYMEKIRFERRENLVRDTKKNIERIDMAKRLYSIYSLLCISNNMSENHVAYLELKLGIQLDLEKIVLELLPLNSMILLQRRVLFQLGIHLLYKLMVFTPDSYNIRKRLRNLIASLPTFKLRYDPKIKDERDKPLKELIKRTLKYLLIRTANPINLDVLKTIISSYNRVYKSSIQVVINIQTLLNWNNYNNYENQDLLKEMNHVLDENMEPTKLVNYLRNKLFMCFFPYINTYKLSNLLMLQGYTMTFRNEGNDRYNTMLIHNNNNTYTNSNTSNNNKNRNIMKEMKLEKNKDKEHNKKQDMLDNKERLELLNDNSILNTNMNNNNDSNGSSLSLNQVQYPNTSQTEYQVQNQNSSFNKDTNYLMYIYRYVKYKMINMWKLFIIYYYLVTSTSNTHESCGDKELIEIYIRFNLNIELLEKIYKIILLNPSTNSTISSKETQGLLNDRSEEDDDIQLCYLIKNSLSNINVKFM